MQKHTKTNRLYPRTMLIFRLMLFCHSFGLINSEPLRKPINQRASNKQNFEETKWVSSVTKTKLKFILKEKQSFKFPWSIHWFYKFVCIIIISIASNLKWFILITIFYINK